MGYFVKLKLVSRLAHQPVDWPHLSSPAYTAILHASVLLGRPCSCKARRGTQARADMGAYSRNGAPPQGRAHMRATCSEVRVVGAARRAGSHADIGGPARAKHRTKP